jgi:hypothetical protein
MSQAVAELTSKMTDTWAPTVFGSCTFQLGYAAAGSHLQFHAIRHVADALQMHVQG